MLLFFEAAAAEASHDPCVFAVLQPHAGNLAIAQGNVPKEISVVNEPDGVFTNISVLDMLLNG